MSHVGAGKLLLFRLITSIYDDRCYCGFLNLYQTRDKTPVDEELVAEDSAYTGQQYTNTHALAGFEPTIPATKRPRPTP
jgi:hypothetical protein